MKTMKKIATLILAMCLAVSCFSMLAYAANGKIMFTDPAAKNGETVEVKGVIERTDSTGFGKVEITMTYDTAMLKFVSGNGVTESQAGTITYTGDATYDTGSRHEFTMKFTALKEGSAKLEVSEAVVKSVSGRTLDYTKGASTITISGTAETTTPGTTTAGDADTTVEVNGTEYKISNEFPEAEIPTGYQKSTLEYDFETYNVVYNENSGLSLAYLIDSDSLGKFFMYVEEDATFAPFEQISISESTTIVLLSDISGIELPKEYKATKVVLNGCEFPAWHDTENEDFYILYAMNSQGEKGLYQLDNAEATYQRFTAPEVVDDKENDSFIRKLSSLLENHLDYVILGTGLGFLLFIIIIVILGVKLYNRNAELDEIYDEYDIDAEDDETEDDVILDLDDEDYDDEDENAEDEATEDSEAEFFVQEGMKEVFLEEETQAESETDEAKKIAEVLPEIFANQTSVEADGRKTDFYDEEEDAFENFSVDFIDLDD